MSIIDDVVRCRTDVDPRIGIDIRDVQHALGTTRNDVGQLCTHSNINVWSKYKPVRFDQLDTTMNVNTGLSWLNADNTWNSLAQWWRNKELDRNTDPTYHCGFRIPIEQINSLQPSGIGAWEFLRPRGEGVTPKEPYRLLDFNQYYRKAVCPFFIALPSVATKPLYLDGKISAFTPTVRSLNLSLNDLFGSNVYIGIALFKGNEMWWRTQIDDEYGISPTITFQSTDDEMLSGFTGTVRLVAFATRKYQPTWTKTVDTSIIYSLQAPGISFSVIGDCKINAQPKILYDIEVELPNDAPLADKNFMRSIRKIGLGGEYVSGETRYGQTQQDRLSRDYSLTGILLKIYDTQSSGRMTWVWSSREYSPNELDASSDLYPESYVKYILRTKEPVDIPSEYIQPSNDITRQYIFKYSY